MLFAFGLLSSATASAEPVKRLVLLRGDDTTVDAALRESVDALVLETLSARAGFSSVYASPIPFEDVELAAGCTARDADCLQRIAATLGADWLLVREFARDGAGNRYLTLIAHDGPRALVTRRAVAEISAHPQASPTRVVPMLVERLYPSQQANPSASAEPAASPEAATPPVPEPVTTDRGADLSAIIGWSMAGVSVALISSSAVLWSLSRRDARAYESADIRSRSDVDLAVALQDRSEKRADIARGLAIGGVTTAAVGVATLLWSQLRPRRTESSPTGVTLLPSRTGLALAWSGAWRGGL